MPVSNYNNGFPNGVTIKDVPLLISQNGNGNVFWVDSAKGSDEDKGTFIRPFATLDYAVGRCTANQGDIIFVAAGHTESIIAAAGLALDISGITIICLGNGSDRATIDFGTAVTADMDVDAENITLINPRFTASIDALTGPIDVNAANFKIVNGEYYDGTGIDTTDCIVAASTATGLKIHGWKYIIGDEAGTQKESNIQVDGVDNLELCGINIVGDFGTGNIENVTDEVLSVFMSDVYVKNTNSGPIPGIVLDANATGYADRVNVRIASGTTYVSNVAKLNWTSTCLGYNADGEGGEPIGTADALSIEGKLDSVIAETDKIDSATLATAPTANSLAAFIASGGTALGTELADSKSLIDVLGSDGTTVTDSAVSVLGAIGANNANNAFDSSTVAANADGSVLERQESIQASVGLDVEATTTDSVQGKLGTDTELADRSMFDLLGGDGFAAYPAAAAPANDVSLAEVARQIYDDVTTANTNIGDASGDTITDIVGKLGDSANTVTAQTDKIDGVTLATAPVANSLAAFIASGGTALGTELADSKSLVDAIGSDGTTLAYGSGSTLGAVGTVHTVQKTLVSSAVLQAGVDITGVSSGGALLIEDVVMSTDATGLATGTNFTIESDNANGVAVFFGETVANLGANKTESLATGSVTAIAGVVLETGKKLIAKSTVADCTGAGEIYITIKFRRLAAGATVAAA